MSTTTATTRQVVIDSSIGPLTLMRDDHGLTYFAGKRRDLPLNPRGGLDRKQYLVELGKAIPVAPHALW